MFELYIVARESNSSIYSIHSIEPEGSLPIALYALYALFLSLSFPLSARATWHALDGV